MEPTSEAPEIDAEAHYAAVDAVFDEIETKLGRTMPIDARSQILAADTAIRFWAYANCHRPPIGPLRIRRQTFFTFVVMAYELTMGHRAGITWNRHAEAEDEVIGGDFFQVAKICELHLLPGTYCRRR